MIRGTRASPNTGAVQESTDIWRDKEASIT